jgi:hypothetical protein
MGSALFPPTTLDGYDFDFPKCIDRERVVRGKLFHSAAAASAITNRLVHKGILIKILGKSKCSNEEVE